MKENIICSGALFYSTSTKRFLFLQRTDKKTQGMWGLVGGQAKYSESAFEGLKREIEEETRSDEYKLLNKEFLNEDKKFKAMVRQATRDEGVSPEGEIKKGESVQHLKERED